MSKILDGAFVYVAGQKDKVECVKCKKIYSYHHSTSSLRWGIKQNLIIYYSSTAQTASDQWHRG